VRVDASGKSPVDDDCQPPQPAQDHRRDDATARRAL